MNLIFQNWGKDLLMDDFRHSGVAILDFGSQYTKLIARRVREQKVYSKIFGPTTPLSKIMEIRPAAVNLSGGPSSVYEKDAPNFNPKVLGIDIPILGICYGLHLLVHHYGGIIESVGKGEYGFSEIEFENKSGLLAGISSPSQVWMSHGDRVKKLPGGWSILANSSNDIVASMSNHDQSRVATQFHPEVSHTAEGETILKNFLFKIADCKPIWTTANFIKKTVDSIRKQVGDGKVITGVSGGVDSSVVAALLNKAIGHNSISVLIDHGLMRKDEAKECVNALSNGLGININNYDESELFLSKLKRVTDPEEKRKIIGNQFIHSFDRIAKEMGEIEYLAQGTLYPDMIESGVSKGKTADLIKSHHNVGGLPENMEFELVEPLKELFKDEVRNIGRELGLPNSLIKRHPFPGPGLGVRIIGEITIERIEILQKADQIYIDILHEDNLYDEIWQAFSVLIPVKTVGVMGDQRTYENLLGIRAVSSIDGMTADWYHMPPETLTKISNRIVNSVRGINRIVYDITSKPPGTIEWE